MLLPDIFENHLLDNVFDEMFTNPPAYTKMPAAKWMSTDIKDLGQEYQLDIELPGYEKKDILVQLSNAYLVISASHQEEKEEEKENGRFVHKERYSGSCKRSFYVGDSLREEDIQASFENGVLKLVFPKEEHLDKTEEKKYIEIK